MITEFISAFGKAPVVKRKGERSDIGASGVLKGNLSFLKASILERVDSILLSEYADYRHCNNDIYLIGYDDELRVRGRSAVSSYVPSIDIQYDGSGEAVIWLKTAVMEDCTLSYDDGEVVELERLAELIEETVMKEYEIGKVKVMFRRYLYNKAGSRGVPKIKIGNVEDDYDVIERYASIVHDDIGMRAMTLDANSDTISVASGDDEENGGYKLMKMLDFMNERTCGWVADVRGVVADITYSGIGDSVRKTVSEYGADAYDRGEVKYEGVEIYYKLAEDISWVRDVCKADNPYAIYYTYGEDDAIKHIETLTEGKVSEEQFCNVLKKAGIYMTHKAKKIKGLYALKYYFGTGVMYADLYLGNQVKLDINT